MRCCRACRGAACALAGLVGSAGERQVDAGASDRRSPRRKRGIPTEVLSLDDFYLGRRDRAALARDVHPLLATRGVPGTHDLALLDCNAAGAPRRIAATVPRASRVSTRADDTRLPPSRWRRVTAPPR